MKETQKHIDAFELYFTLKQNGADTNKAIMSVSKQINVSERTIFRWKNNFDWDGREAIRSNEINKKIEEKTNDTIVDMKVKYLKIIHGPLFKYLEDVESKKRDPLKIRSPRDLDILVKLGLLLQDQPTEHKKDDALLNLIEALKDD
jgi:hypothetical protein